QTAGRRRRRVPDACSWRFHGRTLSACRFPRAPRPIARNFGLRRFGGPRPAAVFSITLFASIGLPTLCNFVGEFLILQGAALTKFSWAAWAAIGVILSAAYMLWMYQRTFFGKPNQRNEGFVDLAGRDWLPLLPLLAMIVWLGCYTQPFLQPISA